MDTDREGPRYIIQNGRPVRMSIHHGARVLPPLPEPCYRDPVAEPMWNEPRILMYGDQCFEAGYQAGKEQS